MGCTRTTVREVVPDVLLRHSYNERFCPLRRGQRVFDGAPPAKPERGGQLHIRRRGGFIYRCGGTTFSLSHSGSVSRNEGGKPHLFPWLRKCSGAGGRRGLGRCLGSEMCPTVGANAVSGWELGWAEAYTSTMAFTTTLGGFPSEEWTAGHLMGATGSWCRWPMSEDCLAESARLSDAFSMGTYPLGWAPGGEMRGDGAPGQKPVENPPHFRVPGPYL